MSDIKKINCKVLVVGAGPGGYVAAIRAGELGLDTIIIEGDRAGGTCLIRGCIPSKALIHAADRFKEISSHLGEGKLGIRVEKPPVLDFSKTMDWKDGIIDKLNSGVEVLLKKAGVRSVTGWATFKDGKTCDVKCEDENLQITAEHVILATGSEVTQLPFMPFGGKVISSTEALSLLDVPKTMTVIGAGYIGLELGIAYRKLGSNVTFIEAADRILPLYDKELMRPVERHLKALGIKVMTGAKAKAENDGEVTYEARDGSSHKIKSDYVLVTVGRKARTEGFGLENMTVDMQGAFIKIDDQCRTSMNNVWAIGDVTGEPMLAHRASAQGEIVAEIIAGRKRSFDPAAIAAVCFTDPEIIAVGLSPEEAKAAGEEVISSKFPLAANGRAMTNETDSGGGFIRVTARKSDHVILGLHAVGAHVSELSGEFALAIEMQTRLEDLAGTIHVHPTVSESIFEASLAGIKKLEK
jgi:dihydrolipoamide dehydrogenase